MNLRTGLLILSVLAIFVVDDLAADPRWAALPSVAAILLAADMLSRERGSGRGLRRDMHHDLRRSEALRRGRCAAVGHKPLAPDAMRWTRCTRCGQTIDLAPPTRAQR
jgi:hypothetical protein